MHHQYLLTRFDVITSFCLSPKLNISRKFTRKSSIKIKLQGEIESPPQCTYCTSHDDEIGRRRTHTTRLRINAGSMKPYSTLVWKSEDYHKDFAPSM